MTPQETALVTILLERLKMTDSPDKDPEAETLIRHTTAEQPDAAYYLVQTVLIQDLSLLRFPLGLRLLAYGQSHQDCQHQEQGLRHPE